MSPSNSSSPKTDQRLDAIVVAAQEKRKMTNPIQVPPQEVVPEMNNLKKVSPQEIMPEVNSPEQTTHEEIVHEVDNLKQVSPQEVVPEVNNSKQGSLQEQVSQEVVPEVGNLKQVSPQEVTPEVNNSKQGSPQEQVSQEVVPEVSNLKQGSPQEVVPEVNNSKQTSPQEQVSQEVVPEVNNLKQVSQEVVPEVNNLKPVSQEVVPEVSNLKQGSPQGVVPEVNIPKQVSPQEVVPDLNNPKQGWSQELVPDLNNPKQVSPQEVVPERKKTERPSFDLRVLRALNKLIKKYPSRDNHAFICNICKRGFPNTNSLCAHQKTHKHDLELERKLKQVDPSYSPGQCSWKKPNNFSQDALSNDKHLGISRKSIGGDHSSVRNMDIDEVMGYPYAPPYGNTSYGLSSGPPLVTHNYNRPTLSDFNRGGIPFGPFKPGEGGSNINHPSLFNGGFTMAPPATPYRPFIVNPSYGSSPSYSYGSYDSTNVNSIGRCSNNSSSQGAISLELSLGPSKWIGGSNNNRSVYPSLNGGVTGGGRMDLNMPVRPLVSRYHFCSCNSLDSVTRNVPELLSKERNKIMVLDDDDEKDNGVIGGHDVDKPAEV